MAYRKFDTGTWQDPWFEALENPLAKLAFIYLWTNEICNPAGIYEISQKRILFELGYGIDTIYPDIKDRIIWYPDRNIIWVKRFFRRQSQNYKFALAALNSISTDKFKLSLFIRYNQKLLESYKTKEGVPHIDISAYHIDTIPIPYPTEQNRTDTDTEQKNLSCQSPPEGGSDQEKKKAAKKKFVPVDETIWKTAEALSMYLLKKLTENNPDFVKPTDSAFHKWIYEIDKMIRIDNRAPEKVKEIIDWALNDTFWSGNVLSGDAVRRNSNKIIAKMNKSGKKATALDPEKKKKFDDIGEDIENE